MRALKEYNIEDHGTSTTTIIDVKHVAPLPTWIQDYILFFASPHRTAVYWFAQVVGKGDGVDENVGR